MTDSPESTFTRPSCTLEITYVTNSNVILLCPIAIPLKMAVMTCQEAGNLKGVWMFQTYLSKQGQKVHCSYNESHCGQIFHVIWI